MSAVIERPSNTFKRLQARLRGLVGKAIEDYWSTIGRIDHTPLTAGQNEVDPKRMEYILARHEVAYCELDPGDGVLVRRDGLKYRIIAGERRWRAAQRAGLKELPAVVREASPSEAFELALVENLQRADLNAMEEAEAFDALTREHGLTQEQVAERVGKDRSTVANAMRLLKLPADVRDQVRGGALEMGHARALLALEKAELIRKAAHEVVRAALSVRATEALVRKMLGPGRAPAKGAPADTANVRALVSRLERRLGTRCRVVQRTPQAGRLEIDYGSLAELDGILDKIGA